MSQITNSQLIDTSDVLSGLFDIDEDQIRKDLASTEGRVSLLRVEERSVRSRNRVSLGIFVDSIHRRLLIASQMFKSSRLPADLVLFSSTQTAHEVAEMSCAVATGKGRLRELAWIFEESDNGPNFEDSLIEASVQLLEQIHDTVLVEVLRRYDLSGYAVLFEVNRPLYEIRYEVGRRLLVSDLVSRREHLETLNQYQNDYGPDIVREFLRRLEKHDLLPV